MKLQVYSEIGKLKTVLLHRPGKELENLTPDLLERLLFGDIPYLKVAQQEHDAFAKTLTDNGVEPTQVSASGRGEFLPVDPEKTKEARKKNRRTEIILTPKLKYI